MLSNALRRTGSRTVRLTAVILALLLVPLGVTSAEAGSSGRHPKPTIVLVHGAWADGTSWADVVKRLQHDGYTVVAPPNNLRGLAADSAYIRDFLQTISGPIVLAAHSYGGAVITNAATGLPNVKSLVYIDAFIPDEGQVLGPLAGEDSALAGAFTDPASVFKLVPYPSAPAGVVDTYLLPKVFFDDFAQDLPRRQAMMLQATQRPASLLIITEPSGPPAWKTIPSYALVGTQDRIITPEAQLAMAKNAGAKVVKVKSSHVSLISHPDDVTRLIEKAAR
ncbi:pimeloyl-ACP methyl ester carboxylesterase [Kribbella amoyensis]|uniref:Pimeloyl-ACP methyl ester carboxylesterase n=1 Tax=Kribbella amoyensis TaxID=996641 RepID=A0A561AZM0_9ACTN|nr:alpha/beta hydrolase [Kribbella amoyensis]TWD72037.1 pimeloyl-ACP methyl ester carboxylesterase [Kribbella amoyensis]